MGLWGPQQGAVRLTANLLSPSFPSSCRHCSACHLYHHPVRVSYSPPSPRRYHNAEEYYLLPVQSTGSPHSIDPIRFVCKSWHTHPDLKGVAAAIARECSWNLMGEGEEDVEVEISSGDTPSRYELLSMVRKHSDFLKEGMVNEQDESDVEMDQRFWNEMLDLYFVRSRESKGRHDDDLVFFVRKLGLHGYGFNDDIQDVPPYFVRRWASKLEKVVGESVVEVDWRRSFYLNLIAHTTFTVTVAICSAQSLHNHQSGTDTAISPIYKIVKTVFASPNRVNFHLHSNKEVESVHAYPNICFAIDDFDDTFDAVVLSEKDHCYCVILNAYSGAAFPEDMGTGCNYPSKESTNISSSVNLPKITLFSGFVSYLMVHEAYDAGKSRFGSLLSIGSIPPKTDKIFMKGPGGRGEVEVAVSGVADQSQENSGPPLQLSKAGIGTSIGTIFRKAAYAASDAAKHAYATAYATGKAELDLLPLKCCLISITLPWEYLAHDLLFKASPPVNI